MAGGLKALVPGVGLGAWEQSCTLMVGVPSTGQEFQLCKRARGEESVGKYAQVNVTILPRANKSDTYFNSNPSFSFLKGKNLNPLPYKLVRCSIDRIRPVCAAKH